MVLLLDGRFGPYVPRNAEDRIRARKIAESRARQKRALSVPARPRLCHVCSLPALPFAHSEAGFMRCCSEPCRQVWEAELHRRDEVREARRLGIPVKLYRECARKP